MQFVSTLTKTMHSLTPFNCWWCFSLTIHVLNMHCDAGPYFIGNECNAMAKSGVKLIEEQLTVQM